MGAVPTPRILEIHYTTMEELHGDLWGRKGLTLAAVVWSVNSNVEENIHPTYCTVYCLHGPLDRADGPKNAVVVARTWGWNRVIEG